MPKLREFAKTMGAGLRRMEKASKRILWAGAAAAVCVYLLAVYVLLTDRFGFDADTAVYWARELYLFAGELLGATAAPVLLFEIFLAATGRKREN